MRVPGQLSNLVFFAVVVGVFWFLVMRPQQQRARQQKEMLEALAPGDEIVTVGGIFATVVQVGDRVRVRIADGAQMEVAKQAIAQVVPSSGDLADEERLADAADETQGEDPSSDA